jgi:hypothetical protein
MTVDNKIKKVITSFLSKGSIPTHVTHRNESFRISSISSHVANLICGELNIVDIAYVIELSEFIENSWTDLELSDIQTDEIILKSREILIRYMNRKIIY